MLEKIKIEKVKRGSDFFYKDIESLPQTKIIGHNIGLERYSKTKFLSLRVIL